MSNNSNLRSSNAEPWQSLGWHATNQQLEKLIKLQELLKQFNNEVNLTRLLDNDDYWINQVLDSLLPFKKELNNPLKPRNCIDVGTGCGFPGIALAIALPGSKFTLVDATSKKTNALKNIVRQLDLSRQINIRNERVELTGRNRNFRGMFDFAMARAVGKASTLAEYLIPLISQSGEAILYKGKWNNVEEKELLSSLTQLNGKVTAIERLILPKGRGQRHVIRLHRMRQCPNTYPRSIGIPAKRPLGT